MEEKGIWRTIRGRRVFIAEGETLTDAMKKSKKFDTPRTEKYFQSMEGIVQGVEYEVGNYRITTENYNNKKAVVTVYKNYSDFVEDKICSSIKQVNSVIKKYGLEFTEI